jgi:hypothetical protein
MLVIHVLMIAYVNLALVFHHTPSSVIQNPMVLNVAPRIVVPVHLVDL